MDEPCRRHMFAQLLARADISPVDMDYLVRTTNEYTGAQLEELANTLYLLVVNAYNDADRDTETNTDHIPIDRQLVDAALKEICVERKERLGFQPT